MQPPTQQWPTQLVQVEPTVLLEVPALQLASVQQEPAVD